MNATKPATLKTQRIGKGWYIVTAGEQRYMIQRYDDGAWGVYRETSSGSDDWDGALWVDDRLSDCKEWIAEQHPQHPTITWDELYDLLEVKYYDQDLGCPVYQVLPDDPDFVINRPYVGLNLDDIVQSMAAAGWIIAR